MKLSPKLTRLVGFAVILLTLAMAGGGFRVVRNDVEQMRESAKENILWSALQVEIELMRFQRALSDFRVGDEGASARRVNDRFDILWSRMSLFRQGSVGERLREYDSINGTIAALFDRMQEAEDKVVNLTAGDDVTARELQHVFDRYSDDLRQLSREVLHGEEKISATLREDLSDSSSLLTVVSALAVAASFLMIIVFARETGRFRELAGVNEKLLVASKKAGRAKSQFLAMMSHELRTPMNGVLGLLALVKQQGLSGHQARLVEQAERSGQQMIGLLGDILDFSALQDDQLRLESKPYEPEMLVNAVRDMFQPIATREGIQFEARADATCPKRVIGDFGRMRQALNHLATYLLETAGTRNIALDISYEGGHLHTALSFEYNKEGGEWKPELIMGNPDASSESFASEALGPAVSRGLIERMGGSTKLFNPTPDRIAVLISVPAKEFAVETLGIRMVSQSSALEAICKAALRADDVRFLDADSPQIPHVVMIEAGGEQESEELRKAAARYPEAVIVALGRPQNPDDFDDIVDVPIDIATIRQADFMQLASKARQPETENNLRYAQDNIQP